MQAALCSAGGVAPVRAKRVGVEEYVYPANSHYFPLLSIETL